MASAARGQYNALAVIAGEVSLGPSLSSPRCLRRNIVPRQPGEFVRPFNPQSWNSGDRFRGWIAAILLAGFWACAASGYARAQDDAEPKANETPAAAQPAAGGTAEPPPSPLLDPPPLAKPDRRQRQPLHRIELDALSPDQVLAQRVLEVFTFGWFVCIGAVVGSFLNVVIYRWPAGLSLLYPPSRCGTCGAPILMRHNLPIMGWIKLRGRCYACDARISVRYPLIEATIAILFLLVAMLEFTSGGANLPVRAPNTYAGVLWTVWHLKFDLLALYLFHVNLLTGLVAAAMIAWDGHRQPTKLLAYLAVTTVVPAILRVDLLPVPLAPLGTQVANLPPAAWWWHPVGTTCAGLITGLLVGGLSWSIVFGKRSEAGRMVVVDLALLAGIVGAAVGWQAAISYVLLAMLFAAAGAVIARVAGCCDLLRGRGLIVAVAATVQILAWLPLTRLPGWPGPESSPLAIGTAVVGSLVLAVIARGLQSGATRVETVATIDTPVET